MSSKDLISLPEGYTPSEHEEYMSPMQLAYFKKKLLDWRSSLQEEFAETMLLLKEKNWNEPDIADRASEEVGVGLELRTQDRYRKLISKIDDAIVRIEVGNYGYCQETGEPIGLKRLEARPIASLAIAAQEKHERFERSHNEDEL